MVLTALMTLKTDDPTEKLIRTSLPQTLSGESMSPWCTTCMRQKATIAMAPSMTALSWAGALAFKHMAWTTLLARLADQMETLEGGASQYNYIYVYHAVPYLKFHADAFRSQGKVTACQKNKLANYMDTRGVQQMATRKSKVRLMALNVSGSFGTSAVSIL